MAMTAAFACVLLLQSFSAALGKYVYVPEEMTWPRAQNYCREHYTDLAPVSNRYDMTKITELFHRNFSVWIGLERNSSDPEAWLWSGGAKALRCFWGEHQPNNWRGEQDNAAIRGDGWNDVSPHVHYRFICFQAMVVREEKTWEGALEHCRRHHRDLASVASDTEMLLIQKELEENGTTEGVWTGLRMLLGDWMWVDGQLLEYQAWEDGPPACPTLRRCGGLRRRTSVGEPKWEWEAYECEQKFHFICY